MANNPYVNKVVYGDTTLIDISDTTATAAQILEGYTAYGADGKRMTGTALEPNLQTKTKSYTPTETVQSETISPDSGYNGLESIDISVGAISPTYIGSEIDRRSSSDLTASGATVTVPAGYYENQANKSVASGTAGTPTATKGAVSNHSISVTPSVTNTTGYISGGTKTGSAVNVSASELVSGNLNISSNATGIDVTNYRTVGVAVAPLLRELTVTPSDTTQVFDDPNYDAVLLYSYTKTNTTIYGSSGFRDTAFGIGSSSLIDGKTYKVNAYVYLGGAYYYFKGTWVCGTSLLPLYTGSDSGFFTTFDITPTSTSQSTIYITQNSGGSYSGVNIKVDIYTLDSVYDGFLPVTVMPSTGLEYETGTFSVTRSTDTPTIYYSESHSTAPTFIIVAKNNSAVTTNNMSSRIHSALFVNATGRGIYNGYGSTTVYGSYSKIEGATSSAGYGTGAIYTSNTASSDYRKVFGSNTYATLATTDWCTYGSYHWIAIWISF